MCLNAIEEFNAIAECIPVIFSNSSLFFGCCYSSKAIGKRTATTTPAGGRLPIAAPSASFDGAVSLILA